MLHTGIVGIQEQTWQSGKDDPLRIVQKIKIWPYYQMVYVQTRIVCDNKTHKMPVL